MMMVVSFRQNTKKLLFIIATTKKKLVFFSSLHWYWCGFAPRSIRLRRVMYWCSCSRTTVVVFAFVIAWLLPSSRASSIVVDVSKIKKTKTGICFCLSPLSCSCLAMMEFVFHGYRRLLLRFLWRSANVSSSKLHLVRRLYSRVAICTDASVFFYFSYKMSIIISETF